MVVWFSWVIIAGPRSILGTRFKSFNFPPGGSERLGGKASVLCSYFAVAMVMSSIEARSFGCYSYRYTYFNKGFFGNHALVFENYCLVVTQAKHCIVFCVLMTKSQSNLYWNRCMLICSVLNNVIIYCKASLVKQVQRKQVQHVVFTYFHIDHNAPYLPPPPPPTTPTSQNFA